MTTVPIKTILSHPTLRNKNNGRSSGSFSDGGIMLLDGGIMLLDGGIMLLTGWWHYAT